MLEPAHPVESPLRTATTASLRPSLNRARRAFRLRQLRSALALSVGATLLTLPLCLAFAVASPAALWAARLVPGLGAGLLGALAIRTLLTSRDDLSFVRTLGAPYGARVSPLLAALELERSMGTSEAPFSVELAEGHLRQLSALAPAFLDRAVRERPTRGWIMLLAGSAVALASGLLAPRLLMGGIRAAWTRPSTAIGSGASTEPITLDLQLTYIYPPYMGLAPKVIASSGGEISAPLGTEVHLATRADRRVHEAFLVIGGQARALTVQGGRDLSGSLVIASPGSYHFRFAGPGGRTLAEGPEMPIAVVPDLPPSVSLFLPPPEEEIEPLSTQVLRYGAEDDYGLTRIELVFRIGKGGQPQRRPLQMTPGTPRHVRADDAWDLGPLSLTPGDEVEYWVEAFDNDTVSGPKVAASRHQVLRVFSEVEHHRAALDRVERLWDGLVNQLADTLESPEEAAPTTAEIKGDSPLDHTAFDLASNMESAAHDLKRDRAAPVEVPRALANVAGSLRAQTQILADSRLAVARWGRSGLTDSPGRKRFGAALDAQVTELEKDAIYLEKLLDHRRIEDLKSMAKDLAGKRRDLAALLERYQKAPDPATRTAIQADIGRLKERIGDLLRRMGELSRGIHEGHLNLDALKQMKESRSLIGALDKIQSLINEGRLEEAMKALQSLGDQMDEMTAGLDRAGGSFADRQDPQLSRDFSKVRRDLDQIADGERQLESKTRAIRQVDRERFERSLKDQGPEFADKLRAKVAESRALLRDADAASPKGPPAPHGGFDFDDRFSEEGSTRARDALDALDRALAGRDFSAADDAALQAVGSVQELAANLRRSADSAREFSSLFQPEQRAEGPTTGAPRADRANQALPPLQSVKRALDSLFPRPSQSLPPEQQAALSKLASDQHQLRAKQDELRKEMDQLGHRAPVFSPSMGEAMRSAGAQMEEAEGSLGARDTSQAASQESAALERLDQVRKNLQPGQGGGSGSGLVLPADGSGDSSDQDEAESDGNPSSNEKVDVPPADRELPTDYRKAVMDAMKQSAPSRYRDQVKEYYQEIVK